MIKSVISIQDLKSVINAIENLQDAGKNADAERLLVELAKEILENVK